VESSKKWFKFDHGRSKLYRSSRDDFFNPSLERVQLTAKIRQLAAGFGRIGSS
jgi:hypothetical protein